MKLNFTNLKIPRIKGDSIYIPRDDPRIMLASTLHEIGHLLYTNQNYLNSLTKDKHLFFILNLCEDIRIDRLLQKKLDYKKVCLSAWKLYEWKKDFGSLVVKEIIMRKLKLQEFYTKDKKIKVYIRQNNLLQKIEKVILRLLSQQK